MSIVEAIASKPWAIRNEAFEAILALDVNAAHAEPANSMWGKQYSVEGSTAFVGIRGVILQDSTILGKYLAGIFGATIIDQFKDDLEEALADKKVSRIVLDINSPGGEALGVEEAAKLIRSAHAIKPVTAFVDGMAASAAYWLASAAGRIVLSGESSQVGSIGVVVSVSDNRERDAKVGTRKYEIVSSQSPMKRVDVATDEGRAKLQEHADQFAAIFIGGVASYRGKDAAYVEANFGRGQMVFARNAVDAGMADAVMSRAELLTAGATSFGGASAKSTKGAAMENPATANTADVAVLQASAKTEGSKDERARVKAIIDNPEAKGREQLAKTLAFETEMSPAAAELVLKSAPKASETTANPLHAAMAGVPNPKVGDAAATDGEATVQSLIESNLALAGQGKKG
jgi:ClpP class serine protease